MAQGKAVTVNNLSVLSRWLFVSDLYTLMLPMNQISYHLKNYKTNLRAVGEIITHKQDHL